MASRRILRVNELLREELAELLQRAARDPELQALISITEVDTSPDLRLARVYVSVFGDEAQLQRVISHLRNASRFLRRQLATRITLRRTPELDFQPDRSIATGARVMQLLRELEPTPSSD